MKNVLVIGAALAVVALLEGLYYLVKYLSERKREDLQRRLQAVTSGTESFPTLLRAGRLASSPFWGELLGGVPLMERMATLLEQAQVGGTVSGQLLLSLLMGLAGGVLGLAMGSPFMAVVLFLGGGAFPTFRLFLARARRSRLISEQLPAALEMIARSLRAGHSVTSAFKLVATEMPGPINLEFARAYEEQNLGVSFYRAVEQMTARVPDNSDLKIFAVSVIVQKETGGNLVEMLEKLADTMRARAQFFGKLAALTAEGEMSGLVLGALPIATALFLMFVNLGYISALVTKPMGRIILTYTLISWFVGLIWLRQMGKVDF